MKQRGTTKNNPGYARFELEKYPNLPLRMNHQMDYKYSIYVPTKRRIQNRSSIPIPYFTIVIFLTLVKFPALIRQK